MVDQILLDYFASDPLDPLHHVYEIFNNDNHNYNRLLISNIRGIDKNIIEEAKNDDVYINIANKKNPLGEDIEAGLWWLVKYLHNEIPRRRIEIYRTQKSQKRPPPYNHEALKDLKVDENKLVPLNQFQLKGTALSRNGFSFTLAPITEASNSSYWLSNYLANENLRNKLWVRLDPFICRKDEDYRSLEYRMWVFGRPLNWEELGNLKGELTGQWFPDILSNKGIEITDFVWSNYNKELHFTCEELHKKVYSSIRGTRYFHSIYDKDKREINHLDGAIRILNPDSWDKRRSSHLNKTNMRKIGERVKLFQINDSISVEQFSGIASSFFVWNQDVINYFQ